jgi:CO dehydrogenase nickel-insertion accessory protein CooC1
VVNKADKPVTALEGEIAATGLKFIGTVPLDEGLNRLSVSNEPIFGYEDEAVRKAIDDIMKKIVEG